MHRRGIVHRDIKPANVLFATRARPRLKGRRGEEERVAKLCDFGVATFVGRGGVVPKNDVIVPPSGEICYFAPV